MTISSNMTRSSILILSISTAITAGIVYAWSPHLAQALALEESPIAWLQSSLLVACACAAGFRAMMTPPAEAVQKLRGPLPWAALALLLVLAALDERFMFHERVQDFILFELLGGDPSLKRLSQAAILAYAVAGVGVVLWLRQAMSAPAWRWCRAGIAVGFAGIAMDATFDSVSVQVFEELLEAGAETLFLCGLFMEASTQGYRRS